MPIKFKIYYACSLYLLLWTSTIFCLGVYYTFIDRDRGNDSNIFYQCLSLFAFALVIAKTIMCVTAVQHYRKNETPSKTRRVLFIIGFCFICLVAVALLLLSIFEIIPEEFMRPGNGTYIWPSLKDMLLDISFFIAALCATDLAIFDLVLLKDIRKKIDENLLSFELDESQQR